MLSALSLYLQYLSIGSVIYEHSLLFCRFIAVVMPESERYGEQFYSDPLSLLPYFFMRQPMQLLVNLLAVISHETDSDLGSSFWGMVLILASTNLLTARIAAGCFIVALLIVLFVAKNVVDSSGTLHCWIMDVDVSGFIIFHGVIWILQETTKVRILRYIILFIGVMNSLFSVYGMSLEMQNQADLVLQLPYMK
ncbi:hypothetical protein HKD37_08G021029 [Glycine soja]